MEDYSQGEEVAQRLFSEGSEVTGWEEDCNSGPKLRYSWFSGSFFCRHVLYISCLSIFWYLEKKGLNNTKF